jgi:glycosyltransferase involved in cell wall biosynthesis
VSAQGRGRRVLFLDLLIPEPDRHASSLRAAQLLTLLRDWDWQVDFLNAMPSEPPARSDTLDRLGARLLPGGSLEAAERHIRAEGAAYDLIYLAWVRLSRPLLPVIREAAPGRPVLYDSLDVNYLREYREARLTGNARTLARALRTRESERAALLDAEASLAITPADARLLAELAPGARLFTVGMWSEPDPVERRPEPATLLFVGNMGAPHNHDCALFTMREIMPLLRPRVPGLKLILAGPDHNDIRRKIDGPDIVLTGWQADLRPLFERATLFLAPLRFGSGLKGKMLQAMARGLPIVASAIAAEGMPLRDGRDCLMANDAAAAAAAVERLLADPAQGRTLAAEAMATLRRHYGRESVERPFAEALASIV